MRHALIIAIVLLLIFQENNHAACAQTEGSPELSTSGTTLVAGKLHGKPFRPDEAELENRQLTIRQGKSRSSGMNITISLFDIEKGEIPEGRSYSVLTDQRRDGSPIISIDWLKDGSETTSTEFVSAGYRLKLSFGKEKTKGSLPGEIEFSIPGKPETRVAGSFVAQVKGFRTINGKVDLTSDSHATLDEVALQHLREKDPGRGIKIEDQRDSTLVTLPDGRKWGYKDIAYSVGGKSAGRRKLQFIKDVEGWRVFAELQPGEVPAAHPVFPPDRNEYSEMVAFISAQQAEKDFPRSFPGKTVHGVDASCVYYDDMGFAGALLRFKIEGTDDQKLKQYVLRLVEDQWQIARELREDESVYEEVQKEMTKSLLGKGCDKCLVEGKISFDGTDIHKVTSATPKFWFRNENKKIAVIPEIKQQDGQFTITGLPPGEYGVSVDIDANPENPVMYPGDYSSWTLFSVMEGNSTFLDIKVSKVIHLTSPQDNSSKMEHWDAACDNKPSFISPVVFSWESLGDNISYDYKVLKVSCKSHETLDGIAAGRTKATAVSLEIPPSAPNEYYQFDIWAQKDGKIIGTFMTHGFNGYGWDYRFRVR